jgi:hypothetical protein
MTQLIRAAGLRRPVEEDLEFSKDCFGIARGATLAAPEDGILRLVSRMDAIFPACKLGVAGPGKYSAIIYSLHAGIAGSRFGGGFISCGFMR